ARSNALIRTLQPETPYEETNHLTCNRQMKAALIFEIESSEGIKAQCHVYAFKVQPAITLSDLTGYSRPAALSDPTSTRGCDDRRYAATRRADRAAWPQSRSFRCLHRG